MTGQGRTLGPINPVRRVIELLTPATRVRIAWGMLVGSVVGWPLSALTFAHGDPMTILALSWLAITITAYDVLTTADVRAVQDGDGDLRGVSPRARLYLAWALLALSLLGWPLSALTFANGEPQTTLALSWIAITITAWDVVTTADVRNTQEGDT